MMGNILGAIWMIALLAFIIDAIYAHALYEDGDYKGSFFHVGVCAALAVFLIAMLVAA